MFGNYLFSLHDIKELEHFCPFLADSIHIDTEDHLDIPIFRYMDLRSLLQIVCDSKMFIARKQSFTDWYEKEAHIDFISLCSHFAVYGLPSPEEVISRHRQEDAVRSKYLSQIPISCWTTEKRDSHLRWKTYDKGYATVRIETTLRKLIRDIEVAGSTDIYAASVRYGKFNAFKPIVSALFVKNASYEEEQEFRLCFIDKNKNKTEATEPPYYVGIKSPEFISSVLISTLRDSDGLAGTIVKMLKRLLPDIDIRQSSLRERTE